MRLRNVFQPRATPDFFPPKLNPLLVKILYSLLPFLLKSFLRHLTIRIEDQSVAKLKAVRGNPCLLLPNHPSHLDALVVLELGRRLKEPFYYLVAREVFQIGHGWLGWLLQRLGCYSVVRGSIDKKSFRTTQELLARNQGRLVIFVEGRISHRSDALLPLEPGSLHLAFLALQKMHNQTGETLASLPSLYVFPVVIRYFYSASKIEQAVERNLSRLERAIGIQSKSRQLCDRIQAASFTVLRDIAAQLDYSPNMETISPRQIEDLSEAMLARLEQLVHLQREAGLEPFDRARRIRNTLDKAMRHPSTPLTSYQQCLQKQKKSVLTSIYPDLERVVSILTIQSIQEELRAPQPSLEHCIEMLRLLEREVFGRFRFGYPTTVLLQVLEPMDLKHRFPRFLQDKKKSVQELLHEIEKALHQGIRSISFSPEQDAGSD